MRIKDSAAKVTGSVTVGHQLGTPGRLPDSGLRLELGWACGSKGVSGLITPDLRVWRERCRDDRDTGRRDHQEASPDC